MPTKTILGDAEIADIVNNRKTPRAVTVLAAKYGISTHRVRELWKEYYGGTTLKDAENGPIKPLGGANRVPSRGPATSAPPSDGAPPKSTSVRTAGKFSVAAPPVQVAATGTAIRAKPVRSVIPPRGQPKAAGPAKKRAPEESELSGGEGDSDGDYEARDDLRRAMGSIDAGNNSSELSAAAKQRVRQFALTGKTPRDDTNDPEYADSIIGDETDDAQSYTDTIDEETEEPQPRRGGSRPVRTGGLPRGHSVGPVERGEDLRSVASDWTEESGDLGYGQEDSEYGSDSGSGLWPGESAWDEESGSRAPRSHGAPPSRARPRGAAPPARARSRVQDPGDGGGEDPLPPGRRGGPPGRGGPAKAAPVRSSLFPIPPAGRPVRAAAREPVPQRVRRVPPVPRDGEEQSARRAEPLGRGRPVHGPEGARGPRVLDRPDPEPPQPRRDVAPGPQGRQQPAVPVGAQGGGLAGQLEAKAKPFEWAERWGRK